MLFLRRSTDDIPELKGLLRQLQPGPPGRVARMLLSAAQKAPAASVVSPKHSRGEPGPSHPKSAGEARDLFLTGPTLSFLADCRAVLGWRSGFT